MAAIVGAAGLAPDVRRGAPGAPAGARQQGMPGLGGRASSPPRSRVRRRADAGRQRALGRLPGAGGRRPGTGIEQIVLTASGGPFRTWDAERLAAATPEEALQHPNWSMGAKISDRLARRLMNKGLELIEAYHLFPVAADRLDVVVHPAVDRPLPRELHATARCWRSWRPRHAHADRARLSWPQRMAAPTPRLDLVALGTLTLRGSRRGALSGPAARARGAAARAARRLPCSMPPTRWRSRPSSTGASAFSTSPASSQRRLRRRTRAGLIAAAGSLDDILAVDAEARDWHSPASPMLQRTEPGRGRCRDGLKDAIAALGANLAIAGGWSHGLSRDALPKERRTTMLMNLAARRPESSARSSPFLFVLSIVVFIHELGHFPRRPLVRRDGQGVLDRLRPRDLRLHRPPRHPLAHRLDPARRLRQVHRRRERRERPSRRRSPSMTAAGAAALPRQAAVAARRRRRRRPDRQFPARDRHFTPAFNLGRRAHDRAGVGEVMPDMPARRAGFQPGDVITASTAGRSTASRTCSASSAAAPDSRSCSASSAAAKQLDADGRPREPRSRRTPSAARSAAGSSASSRRSRPQTKVHTVGPARGARGSASARPIRTSPRRCRALGDIITRPAVAPIRWAGRSHRRGGGQGRRARYRAAAQLIAVISANIGLLNLFPSRCWMAATCCSTPSRPCAGARSAAHAGDRLPDRSGAGFDADGLRQLERRVAGLAQVSRGGMKCRSVT